MIARSPDGASATKTTCSWPFAVIISVIAASVPIRADGTVPRARLPILRTKERARGSPQDRCPALPARHDHRGAADGVAGGPRDRCRHDLGVGPLLPAVRRPERPPLRGV